MANASSNGVKPGHNELDGNTIAIGNAILKAHRLEAMRFTSTWRRWMRLLGFASTRHKKKEFLC
jgi:hypothetical protein